MSSVSLSRSSAYLNLYKTLSKNTVNFYQPVLMYLDTVLPTPRLPAQLGYFDVLCCRSKNCWAGGLKLGYFSFTCSRQLFISSNLPVSCQFRESWDFQEHSFHQFQSNQYRLSTSRGSQQSNCSSTQLGDFGYFTAEKHPNLGNWAYDYLIKIGLLWSHFPWVKKPIYRGLVLWSFGNTAWIVWALRWSAKLKRIGVRLC